VAKYARRPKIVEAEQWYPHLPMEGVRYISDLGVGKINKSGKKVRPGHFVITDEDGWMYTCEPKMFELTYALVEGT